MKKTDLKIIMNQIKASGEIFAYIGTVEDSVAAALSGNSVELVNLITQIAAKDPEVNNVVLNSAVAIIKNMDPGKPKFSLIKTMLDSICAEDKNIKIEFKEVNINDTPNFNLGNQCN